MTRAVAKLLYGLGSFLWVASWPFLAIGQVAIWIGIPFRWASKRCVDKAREWDLRLAARGADRDSIDS